MLQAAIRMFLTKTHTINESAEKLYDKNIGENQKNEDEIRPIRRSWEFVYQRNDHFYECVRKRRKRVKSCPEYMDLRKLSKSLELAIMQLKEICEEGISVDDQEKSHILNYLLSLDEQYLQDNDSTSSCTESSCIECLEEETFHRNNIFYNKNRLSMAIGDDDRLEERS